MSTVTVTNTEATDYLTAVLGFDGRETIEREMLALYETVSTPSLVEWSIEYRRDGVATDIEVIDARRGLTAGSLYAELADGLAMVDIDDCRSYGFGRYTVALANSEVGTVVEVLAFDLSLTQLEMF